MDALKLEGLRYEKRGRVAVISFHRPQVLNAMNTQTVVEMKQVFDHMDADPDIRCVILTGEGRAFCAGEINYEALERSFLN